MVFVPHSGPRANVDHQARRFGVVDMTSAAGQIREALRLHQQVGPNYNEVSRALKISKSVVGKYVSLARVSDVANQDDD